MSANLIPLHSYRNVRVGVLGLGRSGMAAARSLRASGAAPILWDDDPGSRESAEAEGFRISRLTRADALREARLLVVSPGVPHLYPAPHPAVEAARALGVPLDNDFGLLFECIGEQPAPARPHVVLVTGSNGKSTTTALIGHVLKSTGRSVRVAGNIGMPVLAMDPPSPDDILLLEISSYQAELARSLAPEVAVFLNFEDDHLDRHGGRGGYFAAKARIFEIGRPRLSVIGVGSQEGRFLADRMRPSGRRRLVVLGTAGDAKGYPVAVVSERRKLVEYRCGRSLGSIETRGADTLHGDHNLQNAAAAFAACRWFGVGRRQFRQALLDFPGLPHRLELVGSACGISYINDSKATNAAAAARALAASNRIRWIAGGRAKAGGIAGLEGFFPRIAKAYLIGEAAQDFARTLAMVPHEIVGTLEAATTGAIEEAREGETVLLSPGCASFDQFSDYEERGNLFRNLVSAHLQKLGGSECEGARNG